MTTDNVQTDLESPIEIATEAVPDEVVTSVESVWIDGARDGGDVRDLVDSLRGRSAPSEELPKQAKRRKRTGLGRGLGDLIANDDRDAVPTQLQPSAEKRPTIAYLAVVESAGGLSIEIEDGTGAAYAVRVGDESNSDRAVMDVVRLMVDESLDVRLSVIDVETEEGLIVMAIAVRGDHRAVGTAFVGFGRPFAVARAVLSALCDV